ncbi:hypothetical protein BCR32DRAFT_293113 [Anaeromyces robustus]|uniref:Mid2 domain-containing protein n=1 Tax=Anaeromyces robustus TaxID=1754192 RepID=A0A1Y1X7K5_9FUNG|nr:hypothetical protein BCR32DRAFT_293113 [Anaeromyces robustus]|eukprot:ORX81741.1 hypothetical protein BCR32DRAFT_293113 [Anaeromyces robustus]
MKKYFLLLFSIILLINIVHGHITNYEVDLDNVLDQLSKFENSINGKSLKNNTSVDNSGILSTDKSTEEENSGNLNIILPIAIGGVVVATLSASIITFFVLRKKKHNQLYAGAYVNSSSNTSLNNLSRSKKPSYEDLVSIGCEF